MSYGLVIFDLDGTLIDSEPLSCRAVSETLQGLGLDYSTHDILGRFVGIASSEMIATIEAESRRSLPADVVARMEARMARLFETELKPLPGVSALLDRLSVASCVASNSPRDYVHRSLEQAGLATLLPANSRFSADMVARPKPAPDLFRFAATQFGKAPEACLVIEDSEAGVRAACAAGMAALGFVGGSHVGEPDCLAARLRAAGATLTFERYDEAPALLARL